MAYFDVWMSQMQDAYHFQPNHMLRLDIKSNFPITLSVMDFSVQLFKDILSEQYCASGRGRVEYL